MVNLFTKNNFEQEVLKDKGVVLVDLYATWCGPCKMLAPIVDSISEENTEIKVGKVDIDQDVELATDYGIRSVPTLLVFKNGELKEKLIGLQSKKQILAVISGI